MNRIEWDQIRLAMWSRGVPRSAEGLHLTIPPVQNCTVGRSHSNSESRRGHAGIRASLLRTAGGPASGGLNACLLGNKVAWGVPSASESGWDRREVVHGELGGKGGVDVPVVGIGWGPGKCGSGRWGEGGGGTVEEGGLGVVAVAQDEDGPVEAREEVLRRLVADGGGGGGGVGRGEGLGDGDPEGPTQLSRRSAREERQSMEEWFLEKLIGMVL